MLLAGTAAFSKRAGVVDSHSLPHAGRHQQIDHSSASGLVRQVCDADTAIGQQVCYRYDATDATDGPGGSSTGYGLAGGAHG